MSQIYDNIDSDEVVPERDFWFPVQGVLEGTTAGRSGGTFSFQQFANDVINLYARSFYGSYQGARANDEKTQHDLRTATAQQDQKAWD